MANRRWNERSKFLWYWLFLLPLLLFFKGINGFPYPSPDALFSDLTISHFPNAIYLKRSLLEWRTIPLWSPTILSGYPFFANPLSGLWYPPSWFALILPLPMGFNLLVMLHLLWGAIGIHQFLLQQGLTKRAAIFGGLLFMGLPKFFAQYGAGHLTLLYAVPWTPWLLVCVRTQVSGVRYKGIGSWFHGLSIRYLSSGLVLAMIFLADPRWVPFAGLLWISYYIAHSHNQGDNNPSHNLQNTSLSPTTSKLHPLSTTLQYLLSNTLLAGLLSLPLALPLLEYSRLSTRNALSSEDMFAYSMPPARLLGLIFPDFGGFHEWMLYLGGAVLVLVLVALMESTPRKSTAFWGLVFAAGLLISLGDHLPLVHILVGIPGLDLLRVPARALFLVGLSSTVLAAFGMDHMLCKPAVQSRALSLLLVSMAGFCVMLALGIKVVAGLWARNFLWGAGSIALSVLWILMKPWVQKSRQTWFAVLLIITILDLGFVDASVISFRDPDQVLAEGEKVADFLSEKNVLDRLYSPSYSFPQQTAAFYEFEMVDGIDPLQIAAYADYMKAATGVPDDGYSVTLPPFENGEPETANAAHTPDAQRLGLLNVAYVISEFELNTPGLTLDQKVESSWIYKNEYFRPRAWVQKSEGEIAVVENWVWAPNSIRIRATGPGLLVLSEVDYPGWRAEIDGQAVEIFPYKGVFRSVELSNGDHNIVFRLRPISLLIGWVSFGLGIVLLFSAWRLGKNGVHHRVII